MINSFKFSGHFGEAFLLLKTTSCEYVDLRRRRRGRRRRRRRSRKIVLRVVSLVTLTEHKVFW